MTDVDINLLCKEIEDSIDSNDLVLFLKLSPQFQYCLEMDLNFLSTIYKKRKEMFHYLLDNPNSFKAVLEHDKKNFNQFLNNILLTRKYVKQEKYSYFVNCITNYLRKEKLKLYD